MQKGTSRSTSLIALALLALGILLLLSNFLLVSGFNLTSLWPLLLVISGIAILLQGDLTSSSRSFGITRGTVESASAEISAGEIDVLLRGSTREGRLVVGQFAPNSRPTLDIREAHANLRLDRSATPWLAFGDWELNLAADLPWQIAVSTHLGAVQADLSEIIVQHAVLATGFGDLRVTLPYEVFETVHLRSAAGDIHIYTLPGQQAVLHLSVGRFSRVHLDETRYEQTSPGVYQARATSDSPPIHVEIQATFGDIYLT